MKVFIQSIPRPSAQKIHEFKDDKSGKLLNKTKNNRYCKDTISPMYSRKLGGLNTGLLDMVDNPWFVPRNEAEIAKLKLRVEELSAKPDKTDKEIKEYQKVVEQLEQLKAQVAKEVESAKNKLGSNWEYLADKKEITRQELLEKKHGRTPNFYNNRMWTKVDNFNSDVTYMQKFRYALNDGSTVLDTNIPEQEIAYYMFLASKFVANSKREWLEHRFPYATHYISLQEEDEELAMKARKTRNEAILKLSSDEMTDEYKNMICKVLDWSKLDLNGKQVYNLIGAKIESANLSKPGNEVSLFLRQAKHIETSVGREYLKAAAFIKDLVNNRVISSHQDNYVWISRGITIGSNFDDAVSFITDPNKASNVLELKKELKAKILA